MQILLQTTRSHALTLPPDATVGSLLALVRSTVPLPSRDFYLTTSSGKPLRDPDHTLRDRGVAPLSTVLLLPRRRGGELVFYFIFTVFGIAFGVPLVSYIYRKYVYKLIETATESVANARKRTTERMSGAGRRVTSNRISGRFK
ncbi:hypothetical protein TrRE_jg3867 [Triparma retinervis]|uniref:Ubiquitin-like domain-containing protein n=1 Tax=Triparma retinervis TaxID=2557542 RepID=A0A9W7DZC2_9STRA|nr:hypothetical protein TrRE_jg3867 [Triparma retinervis]